MHVNGRHYQTVWMEREQVCMIDQTLLPFEFRIYRADSHQDCCFAINDMIVRGAGAIGAVAGYAMALAFLEAERTADKNLPVLAKKTIESTRPTAANLFFAVHKVFEAGLVSAQNALEMALQLAMENVEEAKRIGTFGNELIRSGFTIGTHCNAGWLGFVDYGSALSPVYMANANGKKVFVYVDETRPRNQGSRLTAWELQNENIPHAIIPDNATAWFMSQRKMDLFIVGADRVAANGDVANKIGTLEKAIAARHFGIPFYVAVPLSTFDRNCATGSDIVIEERDESEMLFLEGPGTSGTIQKIRVCNPGSQVMNPAFDVTPADLITGLITSRGIIKPTAENIQKLLT
jgi:methylthioribose-1-phosphate isomerase